MADQSHSPVKDPQYDLIAVLEGCLQTIWQVETYIQDADAAGDDEVASWFRKVEDSNPQSHGRGSNC